MMNLKLKIVGPVALALAAANTVHAQEVHEIGGSLNASFSHARTKTGSSSTFLNGGNVSGAYNYRLTETLQLGVEPSYGFSKPQSFNAIHTLNIYAGPTINFSDNLENAIFLSLMGGFHMTKTKNSESNSWGAEGKIGKRFALADGISLKPHFAYNYYNIGRTHTHTWTIVPLALSVFLD